MDGGSVDRLTAMELFVRIVETGSLSAAAREFGTTQPSVSRQLRGLEKRLNARLLNRTTRHLTLTEAGRAFYEDCRQIAEAVRAAESGVGALQTSLRGVLRVNTAVAMGQECIAPLAFKFQKQQRELIVDLTLNERYVDLVEEGIDVAVRFGEVQDVNLVARRLGRARFVIVATPAYLKRHGTPKLPPDLANHRGVLLNNLAAPDWTLCSADGETKVRPPPAAFRVNNGHVVRGAILSDLGIGWIPEALVYRELESGLLREVLRGYTVKPLDVHAVYASARHLPAKVRAFVEFLQAEFAAIPGFDAA
jgi:DNA-binding transcriptional LysR family regulator